MPERILAYYELSTGEKWTKSEALKVSWCTYFVHWCLYTANVPKIPAIGKSQDLKKLQLTSNSRFTNFYPTHQVSFRNYTPQPGDMYYMPNHKDHIGIIAAVRSIGKNLFQIDTIDGNSGPIGTSPYYHKGGGLGGSFIYFNTRTLSAGDVYIELPPL